MTNDSNVVLVRLWDCFQTTSSRRRPLFPFLSLLFVSWPTSVLRAIPYYTALHCHNPYITYRSNDSAFMVQCAHRLPREFQRISWKKSISGTHLRSRVALCRLCAQIDSFSLWNLFEITYEPIAWKISTSSKHTFFR